MCWVVPAAQGQVLISLLLGDKLNTGEVEFGLEGGYNWSSITGLEADQSYSALNLGFYFDILLKKPWYIYTGVLVRARNGVDHLSENDLIFLQADHYDEDGDYSQVTKTFLVPILIKYRFKNNLFVELGPQLGLMYNAWVEFNSDIEGKEARIKQFNKDKLNRIDAGGLIGLGYKLRKKNGLSFAVKYYYGFVDVYKEKSGTKNRSLFLSMTVPIGAH
jgi:hypothetical protein